MNAIGPAFWEAFRFWSKVDFSGDCWRWTRCVQKRCRYGRVRFRGTATVAHRVAYRLRVGSIPSGFVLDHVRSRGCPGGPCVNPAHLEVVTPGENSRRGILSRPLATHCTRGHEYTPATTHTLPRVRRHGTYIARVCLICRDAYTLSRASKKRTLANIIGGDAK